MEEMKPWYSEGLAFSCTQCHACCRHDPGFVFLSREDLDRMLEYFSLGERELLEKYCRVVVKNGKNRISLKEKVNYDCIFWEQGCTIYEARPYQCRSFPFWTNYLNHPQNWQNAKSFCPGIDQGEVHSIEVIEEWLKGREEQHFLQAKDTELPRR
jgi:Fe-S-cluster containining protein